jgi:recombination protein RecA
MSNSDKEKALQAAMATIEKQYGRGAIMALGGEDPAIPSLPTISTGSIRLDRALGIGGLPRGRIIEMFGPEASGKTTMALSAIASCQRDGGIAAFVDAEHALDPSWARTLGVDIDRLLVSQPDNGEQALEIAETLVRSGAVDLVVVDSVAALTPKAEIEGEMGEMQVGLQARLMSKAMRKLTGHISKTSCSLIFINQIRYKIGVMFGSPETTTGGNALKYYASVRLDIRRTGAVKNGDEVSGSKVRVRVVKNKLAPPFRDAELEILYGQGLGWSTELLDLATETGIVEKAGAWYSLQGVRMGPGREKAREWLELRPELASALRTVVIDGAPLETLGPAAQWSVDTEVVGEGNVSAAEPEASAEDDDAAEAA